MTWIKVSNEDKYNHVLYKKRSALYWLFIIICIVSFLSASHAVILTKEFNPLNLFFYLFFLVTLFFRSKIFDKSGLIKSEKWIWIYILSFPFIDFVLNFILLMLFFVTYGLSLDGFGEDLGKSLIVKFFYMFVMIFLFIPYRFFSSVFRLQALNLIKK